MSFAPLIDADSGRSSSWKAKNSAAYVTQVNPTTGLPYTTATGGAPVSIVSSGGTEAGVNYLGQLRVRAESTSLFTEEFDSLDTVNRWTTKVSGGSVSASTGTLIVNGSATANAWGGLQSQPTFQAIGLNFLEFGGVFMFQNTTIANTKRFFGMGTIPTTPTLTTPVTDGFGFELDGSGQLWAVVYEAGVRSPRSVNITALAGLANNVPIPFIMGRRADTLLFYVTTNQKPDAVIPLPGLDVTALPLAFIAVNGTPAPAAAPTFVCFGVGIGDTGCNAGSIKDPINPFWQAAVTKPNTAVTAAQSALAVALHPSSPLPSTSQLPSALVGGRLSVEPLGIPGAARQLTAGAASANTALTTSVGRVSIYARSADIRYSVGSTSQTASSTSHFIASGERLDIDVPATPNIAVIRAGTTDGTLEVTELS